MEDVLNRLLDTELQAEALVAEAKLRHDRLLQQALDDARNAEARFDARVPELRGYFVGKEEERASQTIGELRRRYEERQHQMHDLAQQRRPEAVEAAFATLLDPARG